MPESDKTFLLTNDPHVSPEISMLDPFLTLSLLHESFENQDDIQQYIEMLDLNEIYESCGEYICPLLEKNLFKRYGELYLDDFSDPIENEIAEMAIKDLYPKEKALKYAEKAGIEMNYSSSLYDAVKLADTSHDTSECCAYHHYIESIPGLYKKGNFLVIIPMDDPLCRYFCHITELPYDDALTNVIKQALPRILYSADINFDTAADLVTEFTDKCKAAEQPFIFEFKDGYNSEWINEELDEYIKLKLKTSNPASILYDAGISQDTADMLFKDFLKQKILEESAPLAIEDGVKAMIKQILPDDEDSAYLTDLHSTINKIMMVLYRAGIPYRSARRIVYKFLEEHTDEYECCANDSFDFKKYGDPDMKDEYFKDDYMDELNTEDEDPDTFYSA